MNKKIKELKEKMDDLIELRNYINDQFILYFRKPCNVTTTLEIVNCDLEGGNKEMSILLREQYLKTLAKIDLLNDIILELC